jgi:calcineurin-like phosphoesterase family protein
MDVGVNVNGYRPVSLGRVIEELENQPTTEHH